MCSYEIGDLTSFIDNRPLILSTPLVPFILTRLKPLGPSPAHPRPRGSAHLTLIPVTAPTGRAGDAKLPVH